MIYRFEHPPMRGACVDETNKKCYCNGSTFTLVEYGRKSGIIPIAAFLTLLKPNLVKNMWNSFILTLVEPAVIQRIGKMKEALDIAARVEDEISLEDGSYLAMSVQGTNDSSYLRGKGFGFPIQMSFRHLTGSEAAKTQKRLCGASMSIWKRDDEFCLVMLADTNRPEDNIECDYENALRLIVERLKKTLS
jgi:hypothetical protein